MFQRKMLVIDLLILETEVSPRLRSFHNKRIRQVIIQIMPLLGNNSRCTRRRNDRNQLGHAILLQETRQIQRQSRSGENNIRFLGYRSLHHIRKIRHSHHNIHANHTLRFLTSFTKFFLQTHDTSLNIIFG